MSSRLCAVSSIAATATDGDFVLPCQYHDLSGGHQMGGEQRLMLALLADAINVFQKGAMSGASPARRLYVDAERWIMANDSDCDALSFDTVCGGLGINSAFLRRRIIDWKHTLRRQQAASPASQFRLRVTPHHRPTSHRRGRPPGKNATVS